MAVISINYAEDHTRKDLGYKSVQILYGSRLKKKKVFATCDFVVDWFNCNKFFVEKLNKLREEFMESSSVDLFFQDGASKLYDMAIYHHHETKPRLDYNKRSRGDLIFYVKKRRRPTWKKFYRACMGLDKKNLEERRIKSKRMRRQQQYC